MAEEQLKLIYNKFVEARGNIRVICRPRAVEGGEINSNQCESLFNKYYFSFNITCDLYCRNFASERQKYTNHIYKAKSKTVALIDCDPQPQWKDSNAT